MSRKGYKQSEEHKQRISASRTRFFADNPHRKAECGAWSITHGLCRHAHATTPPIKYRMWQHASSRAREIGLPFDIGPADIVIPAFCPLLGIPIFSGNRRSHANSPSLDRIIPSLGYVRGNVWVISHRANAIKQDASLEELELLVKNLRKQWFTK